MINIQLNSISLAAVGGLVLAAVCSSRMLVLGRVTGISGIAYKATKFSNHSLFNNFERLLACLYLFGMIFGGVLLKEFLSESIEDWSVIPLDRLLVGGYLVGFGTVTGNGCTSGHGICGISSFRSRSLFATIVFFFTALATSYLTKTQSYLGKFENTLPFEKCVIIAVCLISTCILITVISWALQRHFSLASVKWVSCVFEVFYGIAFTLGLGISNMTRLSAVISFFDLSSWNPALSLVMVSAIALTTIAFALIFNLSKPLLDVKFYRPTTVGIDAKLLFGEILFGIGWGLVGVCPGPLLSNLGAGNLYAYLFAVALLLGFWTHQYLFDNETASRVNSK